MGKDIPNFQEPIKEVLVEEDRIDLRALQTNRKYQEAVLQHPLVLESDYWDKIDQFVGITRDGELALTPDQNKNLLWYVIIPTFVDNLSRRMPGNRDTKSLAQQTIRDIGYILSIWDQLPEAMEDAEAEGSFGVSITAEPGTPDIKTQGRPAVPQPDWKYLDLPLFIQNPVYRQMLRQNNDLAQAASDSSRRQLLAYLFMSWREVGLVHSQAVRILQMITDTTKTKKAALFDMISRYGSPFLAALDNIHGRIHKNIKAGPNNPKYEKIEEERNNAAEQIWQKYKELEDGLLAGKLKLAQFQEEARKLADSLPIRPVSTLVLTDEQIKQIMADPEILRGLEIPGRKQ